MLIQTFYRRDGSTMRVRANVNIVRTQSDEYCEVSVKNRAAANKFKGGECWGMGRFVCVRFVTVTA